MKKIFKNPLTALFLAFIIALLLALVFSKLTSFFIEKKPNIVLITAMALRPDHLSCYGYNFIDTEAIDKLASDGTLYTNAYCNVPETLYGYTSIFTGKDPGTVLKNKGDHLYFPDSVITLAEHIKSAGYSTAAIVTNSWISREAGLSRDFDTFKVISTSPLSPSNSSALWDKPAYEALKLLEESKQTHVPMFVWIDYDLPATPYIVPEDFKNASTEHPYDRQIMLLDKSIQTLLQGLRTLALYQKTMIIFTAMTGESLGEHKEPFHGIFLYNSTTKVPLIVKSPLMRVGKILNVPVTHSDILPTILRTAGINTAPLGLDGISLLSDNIKNNRPVLLKSILGHKRFGWSPAAAVIKGMLKYIELPTPELYNLTRDPNELNNIIAAHPEEAKRLKELLLTHISEDDQYFSALLDPGPDPKDKIDVFSSLLSIRNSNIQRAIYFYEKALLKDPGNRAIKLALASFYSRANDNHKSKTILIELTETYPNSNMIWEFLGIVYDKEGDYQNASACYEKAISIYPNMPVSLNNLARHYSKTDETLDRAYEYSSRAVELNPADMNCIDTLAEIHYKKGNVQEAISLLEKAVPLAKTPENKNYLEEKLKTLKHSL